MTDKKPPIIPGLTPLEESKKLATDTPLTEEALESFIDRKTDRLVKIILESIEKKNAQKKGADGK